MVKPPAQGGFGMDAMWNDDFHHTAMVALTGRNEAYYTDYRGSAQEFVSVAKYGFLYQGQWYRWQKQPRGTPALRMHPEQLVLFIQNHDQIANSGLGQRVNELAGTPRCRAMTAFMLLAPGTPMLFMGQEFAASSPPLLRRPRFGACRVGAQGPSRVPGAVPQPCVPGGSGCLTKAG